MVVAPRGRAVYSHFGKRSHCGPFVRRGSLIGKAVVLKTTAGNRLQVRVLSSPPLQFGNSDLGFGIWFQILDFKFQILDFKFQILNFKFWFKSPSREFYLLPYLPI